MKIFESIIVIVVYFKDLQVKIIIRIQNFRFWIFKILEEIICIIWKIKITISIFKKKIIIVYIYIIIIIIITIIS